MPTPSTPQQPHGARDSAHVADCRSFGPMCEPISEWCFWCGAGPNTTCLDGDASVEGDL